MKCIEDLFEIPDVIVDIFGKDISCIILNYYNLQLDKNIKLTKNNQTDLNKNNEIIKNNSTILLSSESNLATYYCRLEECVVFDGVKMILDIYTIDIIGKFKITSNEIIIIGYNRSKLIKSDFGGWSSSGSLMEIYKSSKLLNNITTIKISKQELSSYNFDIPWY